MIFGKIGVNDYLDCLKQQSTKQTAIKTLQQTNPIYILRNHMAERAIVSAHQGDFDEVARLFALPDNPYQQQTIATVDDTRMAFANEGCRSQLLVLISLSKFSYIKFLKPNLSAIYW